MLKENYSPMYFLSALGAGGLSVSFYMYLMFLVPHPKTPLATFEAFNLAITNGGWLSVVSILAAIFIIAFAILHFKLLIWNIQEYRAFKETEAYKTLMTSSAEISLMALPLTFAMTINVFFVLGALFVPGLWNVIEFLFPVAILGFLAVGYYAIKIFLDYFSRILQTGNIDCTKKNNLSQLISIFAFSMIGVGLGAPGAMSHYIVINALGLFTSIFFISIAFLLIAIKLILGFKYMFEQGISEEASPSLWIMIPILTIIGIALIRISFGLDHHFDKPLEKGTLFMLTSVVFSLQIIFGLLGYKVMKEIGYFRDYIHGDKKSPVSFALICPGVATMVFGMFFINFGLMSNGVVVKYSWAYFILMIPFIYIQFKTIMVFMQLKKKFAL
ncbi:MAG: hypothetical protein U9N49_12505 [Campylobacterota bacterium]|nr:hypothetical protein [Campylobacterota bacterium]